MPAPRGSRVPRRGLALLAGGLLAVPMLPARAQEPAAATFELKLANAPPGLAVTPTQFRPNSARNLQLVARNPSNNSQRLVVYVYVGEVKEDVALTGPDAPKPLYVIPLGQVKNGGSVAVPFPKPPEPKPAAPSDPKAPPSPAGPTPVPLPESRLTFRLAAEKDEAGLFGRENAGKLAATFSFAAVDPSAYLDPAAEVKSGLLEVTLTSKGDGVKLEGDTSAELVIPPATGLKKTLPKGVYRRTFASDKTKLSTTGTLYDPAQPPPLFPFYVNVDGVPRAFTFNAQPVSGTERTVDLSPRPAVRVVALSGKKVDDVVYALPSEPLRVRVEADSAPPKSNLTVKFNRLGSGETFDTLHEYGAVRDSRFSVVPQDDGGLGIANVTGDRVLDIDVRGLRGPVLVRGVLKGDAKSTDLLVVLDDTKPEVVKSPTTKVERFVYVSQTQVEKGKSLAVEAFAEDGESEVASAFFFSGDAPPDGVFPPDFKKVIAKVERLKDSQTFRASAQLPIPTDTTGPQLIGVAFVNKAGLTVAETQKIELVDPATPKDPAAADPKLATGTLKGEIFIGEVPQPNLAVVLTNEEGKQKFGKTDGNGRFKFEKIPVGPYKVSAAKPDASFGTKGEQSATVEKDKEAKVEVRLTRTGK